MPSPADDVWEQLFRGLALLRDRWPMPEWTYDRRLRCVASAFQKSLHEAALDATAALMPTSFTAETLAAAPPAVQELAARCGGLRPTQALLWGGEAGSPGAFGLVWPWGDGATVSLRIGLHDVDAPKERYPRLRDVFGIPQAPPG
jgi:hypothetical protein